MSALKTIRAARPATARYRRDLLTDRGPVDELLHRSRTPEYAAIGGALDRTFGGPLRPEDRAWIKRIERRRQDLENDPHTAETCRLSSKSKVAAQFLYHLAKELHPAHVVELGACYGLSASYLAAGSNGLVTTLEGDPDRARVALLTAQSVGLANVRVREGLFAETLPDVLRSPPGLVFIDGHHDEHATLQYFNLVLPLVTAPKVIVFDDITWTDGMKRAWTTVQEHPRVGLAMTVTQFDLGVIVLDTTPLVLTIR